MCKFFITLKFYIPLKDNYYYSGQTLGSLYKHGQSFIGGQIVQLRRSIDNHKGSPITITAHTKRTGLGESGT